MRKFIICLALVFLSGLTGCTQSVKFDPANRQEIKSIAILTIQDPPGRYRCNDTSFRTRQVTTTQFGLIGALLGPGINNMMGVDKPSEKHTILEEALNKQNFSAPRLIYNGLKDQLTNAGYNITYAEVQRKQRFPAFLKDYADIKAPADAYLDVVIDCIGCYETFMFKEKSGMYYAPWVSLSIRLVKANNGKVLYATFPVCGLKEKNLDYTKIKLYKTYTWDTFE